LNNLERTRLLVPIRKKKILNTIQNNKKCVLKEVLVKEIYKEYKHYL